MILFHFFQRRKLKLREVSDLPSITQLLRTQEPRSALGFDSQPLVMKYRISRRTHLAPPSYASPGKGPLPVVNTRAHSP